MHRAHPVEVTKDRGDHLDMSSEEMEVYRELLRQLEPTFEEESWFYFLM